MEETWGGATEEGSQDGQTFAVDVTYTEPNKKNEEGRERLRNVEASRLVSIFNPESTQKLEASIR